MKACVVEDCGREDIRARGMCSLHYQRWWATGDTGPARMGRGGRSLSNMAKREWMRRTTVGIHGINPITRQPCGAPLRPVVYFGHAGAYCDACRIGGHPTVSPAGTSGVLP